MGTPDLAPLRMRKTAEVIADRIRGQIARGELAAGDRLPPEDELMAALGVARTTVREALRILESEGLLVVRRGRGGGPRVSTPTIDGVARGFAILLQLDEVTMVDLYQAREIIEPELAATLARNRSPADVDALRTCVEEAAAAAEIDDRARFGEAAARIHEVLVDRAGNKTLAHFASLLHELVERSYIGGATDEQTGQALLRKAVRSYRRLLELIEEGDDEGALVHWRKQMAFIVQNGDPGMLINVFD